MNVGSGVSVKVIIFALRLSSGLAQTIRTLWPASCQQQFERGTFCSDRRHRDHNKNFDQIGKAAAFIRSMLNRLLTLRSGMDAMSVR